MILFTHEMAKITRVDHVELQCKCFYFLQINIANYDTILLGAGPYCDHSTVKDCRHQSVPPR